MKKILSITGINTFIAIKVQYNFCVDSNDFYKMLKRRLTNKTAKEIADFFKAELHYHFKEYAQYQ